MKGDKQRHAESISLLLNIHCRVLSSNQKKKVVMDGYEKLCPSMLALAFDQMHKTMETKLIWILDRSTKILDNNFQCQKQ